MGRDRAIGRNADRLAPNALSTLSERIAQFGIDKLDCGHEWRPSVCDQATIRRITGAASRNDQRDVLAASINSIVAMGRAPTGRVTTALRRMRTLDLPVPTQAEHRILEQQS